MEIPLPDAAAKAPVRTHVARAAELALGVVFLAGAILKARDINLFAVQIDHYGVVPHKSWLPLIALAVLALESGLGCALLLGLRLRKLVLSGVGGLILLFSGLITYAWVFHGLKDCGCFGPLEMSPGVSLLKNLVLAALVAISFVLRLPLDSTRRSALVKLTFSLLLALGLAGYAHTKLQVAAIPATIVPADSDAAERLFTPLKLTDENGQEFDLGKGDYLVAVMSMTCEDCQASVPTVNELQSNLNIPLVALCFEEHEGALREFREKTQAVFPLLSIGDQILLFNNLIGDEPPRFHAIHDGKSLKYWDMTPPTAQEVADALPR